MPDLLDSSIALEALYQLPLAVVIVEDQRIIWVNQKFREISGYTDEQLLGITPSQSDDRRLFSLFTDNQETLSLETLEQQTQLSVDSFSLPDKKVIYVFKDVTQQHRLENKVKQLDRKDAITGLFNSQIILENLASQVTRSRRYGNPLALLRLSVIGCESDIAKRMKAIAEQLKDRLRWADCLGTLDDNTILVILPETCLEEARELAAKLVNDRAIVSDGCNVEFGYTAWQKGDDPAKMLKNIEENQDVSTMALLS
ncbi:MAG: PAS domain-containing protein [Methylococcales bacterium]